MSIRPVSWSRSASEFPTPACENKLALCKTAVKRPTEREAKMAENVVGETGFEPATLCSQSQREERISGPEGVKPDAIPSKGIKGLPGPCKTTVGGSASADLSGLHVYVRAPGPHVRFTVDRTSYIRNLNRHDPEFREPWAVHYEAAPKRNANGSTTFSLIIPMLVVTGYLAEQKAIADRIAAILEKHWDDADV